MRSTAIIASAAGTALLLLFVVSRSPYQRDPIAVLPDTLTEEELHDRGIWRCLATMSGSWSLYVSPSMIHPGRGRVRFVVVSLFLPGTSEPATLGSNCVAYGSSDEVVVGGEAVTIRARPVDGLIWGDVRSETDLLVQGDDILRQ